MTDPIELLREISETQILFRHNLELDAKVCNLLAARAQAEQPGEREEPEAYLVEYREDTKGGDRRHCTIASLEPHEPVILIDDEPNIESRTLLKVTPLYTAAFIESSGRDGERLDWFEQYADKGGCPSLIYDDDGNWAVAENGMQNIRESGTDNLHISHYVSADAFKPTVREAIDAARSQGATSDRSTK